MIEPEETTATVTVTDIIPGDPPSLLTSELVPMPGGRSRPFSQRVQVPDAGLYARLVAEVRRGDSIQVTVVTVWPEGGRYYTYLADFCTVSQKPSAAALATSAV